MAYWLLKSEPGTWSWEDQIKKGDGPNATVSKPDKIISFKSQ